MRKRGADNGSFPSDAQSPRLRGERAEWMLAALLARRHLDPRTLAARMRDAGYPISNAQTYRYVKTGPRRFLDLIAAICCALDCGVVDLIGVSRERRIDADNKLDPPFRLPGA